MQTDSENSSNDLTSANSSGRRMWSFLTGLPMQMVALALASRIGLFTLAWYVSRMIPPQEDLGSPKALTVWGNWDTWHYVTIGV